MKTFIVLAVCLVGALAYKAPEQRIFNGYRATTIDFPYQVGIEVYSSTSISGCGGSIITNKIILTAAHCFMKGRTGRIHAGSNRWMEGVVVPYNKVVVHENFIPDLRRDNDIALIFLDNPLPLNGKTIAVLPLASNDIEANDKATVSGYGNLGDNIMSYDLYYAPLTVRDSYKCGRISATMICAGGNNLESTCQGDSGGPLVIGWPEDPHQIGIVSFGGLTCEIGKPTVFTRVSSYLDWIQEHQFDY